jgi:acetylornithine deacetylase/succinyl-diaminopimelate desuccinylase-like protein
MNSWLLEWCKRLIATPSVTTDGTRRIAELCASDLLAPAGIQARIVPSIREHADQVNLLAIVQGRDSDATPVVFNTHLDTVPPGDRAQWTACAGDPFTPTIVEDRIYGLGAADTKLDFIAKVAALIGCGKPRRTIYLAATFGEEHGLIGVKEMGEAKLLPAGAMAFVGEPSQLKLITAHKGLSVFQLEIAFTPSLLNQATPVQTSIFIGRAAHSSTPALGVNAIRSALAAVATRPDLTVTAIRGGDAVNKVAARCDVTWSGDSARALSGDSRSESAEITASEFIPAEAVALAARFVDSLYQFAERDGPAEDDFAPPTLTCNAGVIESVPGSIRIEFELRSPPSLSLSELRDRVLSLVADMPRGSSVELKLHEGRANPGFRCAPATETIECAMAAMARAGLSLETGVKAGCTEAGIYAAAGLNPVVIGPGPSVGVIHAPNEYNLLSQVEAAVRFYSALLEC